jgi:hypothetical protein
MREFKIGDKVKIPSDPDSEWVSIGYNDTVDLVGRVVGVETSSNGEGRVFVSFPCTSGVFFYSTSYLLTEPYNQSEQPMENDNMNKFSEEQIEILKELRFDTLEVSFVEGRIMGALAGTNFETPKPKTRPLTHFEILKMDAVFRAEDMAGRYIITNEWSSEREVEKWGYCLKSDLLKADSLEDVIWKPLTTEES